MKKLQLYIYKAVRGFKSVQNINPAEHIQRHIRDVRQALESLDYDPAEKYLFYLLSYIEEGVFFTILRTIPDKPLDHLASIIFIPNGLQIDRNELADIVHRTTRMVSNPSVSSEDIMELHTLFSKEYPVEDNTPAMVESLGREYAFSYYGGDTGRRLDDFFGPHIYQTEFLKYAGVVLGDADLEVSVDSVDLTDEPLCEPATLLPPEPTANGFAPYLFGKSFNRPFRASMGKEIEVVWKRNGFNDIPQNVAVVETEQTVEPISTDESRKTINRDTFYITAHGGKVRIYEADITVNGVAITDNHAFSYDDLKNSAVVVRAKGYRPFQATLDLAATSQALISLNEQKRVYCFEMPVKSSELGSPIRFEIHTKRQLTDSPLEGYSLLDDMREGTGRFNHLHYTGGASGIPVRQAVIFIIASLIAGFLLGWLIMSSGKFGASGKDAAADSTVVEQTVVEVAQPAPKARPEEKKDDPTEQKNEVREDPKPDVAAQPETQPSGEVTAASLAYLDANAKWTREDLEKQPGLAGLFDDMNNFRLDRVANYWGPKLGKSKRFEKVAYHAKESTRKKIFKPEGTYCSGNDDTITIQSYLNRIDPAATK